MIPSTIHSLAGKRYRWINVTRASETELQYLEKTFGFHPLDVKDCLPPIQRPKAVPRPHYIFAIFVFPVFNQKTQEIETRELDLFFDKNVVVTVHDGHSTELRNFFELLEMDASLREELLAEPVRFVSQLLDELFDACFPLLHQISNDIDTLRGHVLHGYSRQTVHEVLRLKNNIVAFRKTMQPHRDMLKRVLAMLPHYFKVKEFETHYLERLVDHTKEIWDHLETYHNAIDAVEDTHSTLLSFRLNEIMKTLTIVSVVLLSLSFLANLFIIPALSVPIVGHFGDFWAIAGIMTLVALTVVGVFKRKRWL